MCRLQDWELYISPKLDSIHPTHTHDIYTDYAFGPTPLYSYSKALLNKLTRLQHIHYNTLQTSNINNIDLRFISVCPGNFVSSMSQPG